MEAMILLLMAGALGASVLGFSHAEEYDEGTDQSGDAEVDNPECNSDLLGPDHSSGDETDGGSGSNSPVVERLGDQGGGGSTIDSGDAAMDPFPDADGSGGTSVFGEDLDETLTGGSGMDTVSSGGGNDVVYGGDGSDLIDGRANLHRSFDGGTYDWFDLTHGGSDTLYGGSGEDTLGLGFGDVVFGGSDADTFVVYAEEQVPFADLPRILDFDRQCDGLRIVLDLGPEDGDENLGDYLGGGEFEYVGEVTVLPSEDGSGSVVYVDGVPRVVISGVPSIDPSSIEVRAFVTE